MARGLCGALRSGDSGDGIGAVAHAPRLDGTDCRRSVLAEPDTMQPLRIWVPSCATGEEAYSMAMLLITAIPMLAWQTADRAYQRSCFLDV